MEADSTTQAIIIEEGEDPVPLFSLGEVVVTPSDDPGQNDNDQEPVTESDEDNSTELDVELLGISLGVLEVPVGLDIILTQLLGQYALPALNTTLFTSFLFLSGDTRLDKTEDSSKSEPHGDARSMEKAEKQIKELEKQLKGANKKTQQRIRKKIQNIREAAQRAKKGETHHRR